jgi:hypothetical protein
MKFYNLVASVLQGEIQQQCKSWLLKGKVTHFAIMMKNDVSDYSDGQPVYLTLYDIENENILTIVWNVYVKQRLFDVSLFNKLNEIPLYGVQSIYSIICFRESIQSKRNVIIHSHSVESNTKMYDDSDIVYVNINTQQPSILHDVTNEAKEIFRGCKATKCVLSTNMFTLLLKHFYQVHLNDVNEAVVHIMDTTTYDEHIYKAENMLIP